MTDDMSSIIARIKKLLALAENNSNENEAAMASAKALELMESYNIDMAVLGKSGKGRQGAPRKDNKEKGGLYGWQRDLWKEAAELNMCSYWSIKGTQKGAVYEHRILGSEVNVIATKILAEYLQGTVERLAKAYAKDMGYSSCFVREAIAYREGMANRLTQRLRDKRRQRIEEEARKAREDAVRTKHPGAAPGTSVALVDVVQSEQDLNSDYTYGWEPGTTAQRRADRKAREEYVTNREKMWNNDRESFYKFYSEEDVEYMKNSDKQKADFELYLKGEYSETYGKGYKPGKQKEYKYRERAKTEAEKRADLPSFGHGYVKGNDVGLDQQIDEEKRGSIA